MVQHTANSVIVAFTSQVFPFRILLILLQNYGFSLELPNDFLKKRERTDWFVEK